MLKSKPEFSPRQILARHVCGEDMQPGNVRPAPKAFQKLPREPRDKLSVNSLTMISEKQLAKEYQGHRLCHCEVDRLPVFVATANVEVYVESAKSVGTEFTYDAPAKNYRLMDDTGPEAFSHDPKKDISPSHCVCNYTADYDRRADFRHALRLAGGVKCRPHK